MKELTTEEKAQRYDEALKIAKDNYDMVIQCDKDCSFARDAVVNTFHHMFPELEESEDERIRKAIINIFATHKDYEIFYGVSVEDILAWLEKQGKNNMGISEATKQEWSEDDEKAINDIMLIIEAYRKNGFNETHKQRADNAEEWLKFLKPKNTWKPNDEQMQVLWKYAEQNNKDGSILTSLYQELKKLKGE